MVQIIEKPDWVSWDEIHEVLVKAHAQNRANGINMRKPTLPGEEIAKEIENDGKMFVAIDGEKVVGTAAVKRKKLNLWCGKGDYAYFCFASVLPEYSGQGIYKQLCIYIERESIKSGLSCVMFDTHEKNYRIGVINLRNGYKKVSYKCCGDHNNIIFVKWLKGCPYSDFRCWYEFHKRKMIMKAKTGIKSLIK